MKILVVSLLRLGDFVLAAPVLTGLRQKHPKAQIDVWVHKPVAALKPLFPRVDRWWTLDREELQSGLGRADVPFLTSFDVLREQCETFSNENYDLIINLTQTRFSGFLMGAIRAKSKLGLTIDSSGRVHFHSPWFRYLNDQATETLKDVLHFSDVFAEGAEIGAERLWEFKGTPAGKVEASPYLGAKEIIAVQCLTSDGKKNWASAHWAKMLTELSLGRPAADLILFAAPSEKAAIEAIALATPPSVQSRIKPFVCSLDGALAVLEKASLLITGDTSIKHLANSVQAKVIELSLGSSDYRRTGIFKTGSLILHSKASCAPCPHSGTCSQPSHICADSIVPEDVTAIALHFLEGRLDQIQSLAATRKDRMAVSLTRRLRNGFWYAGEIGASEVGQMAQDWIERSVAKFLFNGREKGALPTFGSEVYGLAEDLRSFTNLKPILERLDFLEAGIEKRRQVFQRARREFSPLEGSAARVVDIGTTRQMQSRLTEMEREIEIQSKMVRTLKANLTEKT